VEKIVRSLFSGLEGIARDDLVAERHTAQTQKMQAALRQAQEAFRAYSAEAKEYESEVLYAIRGTSKFNPALLNNLYEDAAGRAEAARIQVEQLKTALSQEEKGKEELNRKFAQLQSWADMYDSCDLEARKMIVSEIMPSVKVRRDYELDITLNASCAQFGLSLEDLQTLAQAS